LHQVVQGNFGRAVEAFFGFAGVAQPGRYLGRAQLAG